MFTRFTNFLHFVLVVVFSEARGTVFPEEHMTVKQRDYQEILVSRSLSQLQQLDYRTYFTDIMHKVRLESDLTPKEQQECESNT